MLSASVRRVRSWVSITIPPNALRRLLSASNINFCSAAVTLARRSVSTLLSEQSWQRMCNTLCAIMVKAESCSPIQVRFEPGCRLTLIEPQAGRYSLPLVHGSALPSPFLATDPPESDFELTSYDNSRNVDHKNVFVAVGCLEPFQSTHGIEVGASIMVLRIEFERRRVVLVKYRTVSRSITLKLQL